MSKHSLLLHLKQLIERGHTEAMFNVKYLLDALDENSTGTVEVTHTEYDAGQFTEER